VLGVGEAPIHQLPGCLLHAATAPPGPPCLPKSPVRFWEAQMCRTCRAITCCTADRAH